ncbi:MAG: hypothetical protein U9Q96_02065 [Patescibacteria group bacterium]|nr:hypothetical protein [Patescibacteria group bacterium]
MSDMARLSEEFGKDHGLIHEAVVTGRKVGAKKAFWSGLAHDESFFKKVLRLAEEHGYVDLINGIFVPAEAQLEIVKQRNTERNWGFTDQEFASLGESPVWPDGKLSAIVLVVELDTIQQTFEEAWRFAKEVLPDSWRWDKVLSDGEHLRLYPGIERKRGLSWRVIDLGVNQLKSSNQVCQAIEDANLLPHSAVLWAASYFPKWVQAMDGKDIPYVNMPGYQLTVPGYQPWTDVPYLHWYRDNRQVDMNARYADNIHAYWAVPVFRE